MGQFKSDEKVASETIYKYADKFGDTWIHNESTGHYIDVIFEPLYDEWHVWRTVDMIAGYPVVKIVPKTLCVSESAVLAYLKSQDWTETIH